MAQGSGGQLAVSAVKAEGKPDDPQPCDHLCHDHHHGRQGDGGDGRRGADAPQRQCAFGMDAHAPACCDQGDDPGHLEDDRAEDRHSRGAFGQLLHLRLGQRGQNRGIGKHKARHPDQSQPCGKRRDEPGSTDLVPLGKIDSRQAQKAATYAAQVPDRRARQQVRDDVDCPDSPRRTARARKSPWSVMMTMLRLVQALIGIAARWSNRRSRAA